MRLKIAAAFVIVAAVLGSVWWFYGPEHWLPRVTDFAAVTVDGRQVHADTYTAHPTLYESDGIVLVAVPGEGNYLFNFGEEKFRQISGNEFVRLYRGVVIFRLVSKGNWLNPFPFQNLNEFRIVSASGHTVAVKF